MKIIQGIAGFAIGFAIVLALEFGLLMLLSEFFNSRLLPKGIGWIVIPVLGGILGWKFGYHFGAARIAKTIGDGLNQSNQNFRIWLVSSALWLLIVLGFVFVFEPFGYSWNDDEYTKFFTSLFGPPLLGLAVVFALPWMMKTK